MSHLSNSTWMCFILLVTVAFVHYRIQWVHALQVHMFVNNIWKLHVLYHRSSMLNRRLVVPTHGCLMLNYRCPIFNYNCRPILHHVTPFKLNMNMFRSTSPTCIYPLRNTISARFARKKEKRMSMCFTLIYKCPFANSGPCLHGYGVWVGLLPMLIGGPWVTCYYVC